MDPSSGQMELRSWASWILSQNEKTAVARGPLTGIGPTGNKRFHKHHEAMLNHHRTCHRRIRNAARMCSREYAGCHPESLDHRNSEAQGALLENASIALRQQTFLCCLGRLAEGSTPNGGRNLRSNDA